MWIESKTFSGRNEQLTSILSWIYAHVETFLLSSKDFKLVQLALEEAVVNILKYAIAEDLLEITITIRKPPSDDQFEIELKDNGKPFNPLIYPVDGQSSVSIEKRKPGGLGVMLIKKCMSAVTYRFEEGHNILTLIKNIIDTPN